MIIITLHHCVSLRILRGIVWGSTNSNVVYIVLVTFSQIFFLMSLRDREYLPSSVW